MNKSVRYDWLSFSFNSGLPAEADEAWFYGVVDTLETKSEIAYALMHHEEPEVKNGRRPYSISYGNRFVTVFMSPTMEWSLCEITGAGCELLTNFGQMETVINQVQDRVTRIDVAIDIQVGEINRVEEIVSAGYSARFTTKSDVVSGTGRTHYIGSRTSERMCRVYQYNPPHPRADLLRIEFELKGKRAKQLAALAPTESVRSVAQGLLDAYSFKSPLVAVQWGEGTQFEPLRGKQRHNNTIAWIHKQVVPAVHKLVEEGVIDDLEKFIRETFLDSKGNSNNE